MKFSVLFFVVVSIATEVAVAQEFKSSSDFFEHDYANVADPRRVKSTSPKDSWSVAETNPEQPGKSSTPQPDGAHKVSKKPFSPRAMPQGRNNTFELGRVDREENGY